MAKPDKGNSLTTIAELCLKKSKGKITKQYIILEFIRIQRALIAAGLKFKTPFTRIEVSQIPSSKFSITFGQAWISGYVVISDLYIGSTYLQGLRGTILHELAHLYVGIDALHNKSFKRALSAMHKHFGWSIRECTFETKKLYCENSCFFPWKYKIYGILEDGNKVFFKNAARKDKLYVSFPESGRVASSPLGNIHKFIYESGE